MSTRYRDVVDALRTAYDKGADRRDREPKAPWKLAERDAFLRRLREHSCERLLEVGAGTGQDAAFFRLFFLGGYGGDGHEGVFDADGHHPPRFFSWRTDDQIQRFTAAASFDLVDFHVVELGEFRFQSLTLCRGRATNAPEGAAPEL
jgi:hypothetical protein